MALTKVSGSILKDPLNLGGEVSIGGTLTYQDVTNVDAIGIITARAGVNVSGGQLDVGSNIKLGNAGVITATSFVGSGANLTGIALTSLNINGNVDNRIITATGNQYTAQAESNLTFDGTKLTVTSSSKDLLYLNSTHTNGPQVPFQTSGTTFAYIGSAISLFSTGSSTDLGIRAESSKHILFGIGGNEKFRIDSSGRLHIATGGSTTNVSGNADDIIIGNTSTSNETGITLFSTTASSIRFNDAAGTDGAIEYAHSARQLRFNAAGANRLIFGVNGNNSPVFSMGTGSSHLNNNTTPDRASVKIGGLLHLEGPFGNNATPGMYYNCYSGGNDLFYRGSYAPSSGDRRPCAYGQKFGGHYFYGDTSSTAWNAQQQITSMATNMQITSQGYVRKPNNPSFHVGNPNVSGSSSGAVWKCNANAIYSNVGSHYDNSTGRFTAPITGSYFFFHWGMSQSANQTCDIYSRKNGSRDQIGTSYNHPSGGQHDQFGCSYVRYLTTGDYVDVYTSNGNVYNNSDGRHGGWGGWLIG